MALCLKEAQRDQRLVKGVLIPITCINDHLVSAEAFPPRSEYRSKEPFSVSIKVAWPRHLLDFHEVWQDDVF